ncbi:MAG: 19 kDa lipoprotein antigen [Mycobacterium sp.]|jgi:lipoprotein LpqH|nr:19 kDa lipoprotein antigen [Mycobacterium sp.]
MVTRSLLLAVAGSAIVVAAVAGCSNSTKSSTSSTLSSLSSKASSALSSATASASRTSAPGVARVVIDGQDQNVQGKVTCTTVDGNVNIAIGDPTTGITAVVSNTDPPVVHSVGLGNINGVTLGYQEGVNQGNAQATRDGNSYKITGTATGVNASDPLHPVIKPFEIDVTCP